MAGIFVSHDLKRLSLSERVQPGLYVAHKDGYPVSMEKHDAANRVDDWRRMLNDLERGLDSMTVDGIYFRRV